MGAGARGLLQWPSTPLESSYEHGPSCRLLRSDRCRGPFLETRDGRGFAVGCLGGKDSNLLCTCVLLKSVPASWPAEHHVGTIWVYRREHPGLTHNFKYDFPQMRPGMETDFRQARVFFGV